MEKVQQFHKEGDEQHNHAGFSNSVDLKYPANPNAHGHAIYTNGLAFEVEGDMSPWMRLSQQGYHQWVAQSSFMQPETAVNLGRSKNKLKFFL